MGEDLAYNVSLAHFVLRLTRVVIGVGGAAKLNIAGFVKCWNVVHLLGIIV